MCRLQNIAMRDYQESVTTGQTQRQTDKLIHMCRYASQATQQSVWVKHMCPQWQQSSSCKTVRHYLSRVIATCIWHSHL